MATAPKVPEIQSVAEYERFYIPELDVLRFFAFLAVFIMHVCAGLGATSIFLSMGRFGVDLFFTLSAFLITELLLREKERCGALNVQAFYVRRILRIWPLYFAFLAGALALRALGGVASISPTYLIAFAFFVGNFAQCWLPSQPSPGIGPLWSVSIEEQFYLTWPVILRPLSRPQVAVAASAIWGSPS